MALREAETVTPEQAARLANMMQRRLGGEPVARILGEKEFYGLGFGLNAATLVPRPETELLVDLGLKAIGGQAANLLDLGTGTGCIPIAILINARQALAVASDVSAAALTCAHANAVRHDVTDRLALLQGSWFEALGDQERKFDLITANPPYIESAVIQTLDAEVRVHDPLLALDGGPDGLDPYRIIVGQARRWLHPGGQLLVEIGSDQGRAVAELFRAAGFGQVGIRQDLAGLDRVVLGHNI